MAGFLDKETRVIDMTLTMDGKRLLAAGRLQFVYFSLFDDEVDYNPYIAGSGSMSWEGLSGSVDEQVEASLVREATSGYVSGMNSSGSDYTNVRRPLFTMKQGSQYLPRMVALDAPEGPVDIEVRQRKLQEMYVKFDGDGNVAVQQGPYDRGYERFQPESVRFDMVLSPPEVAPDRQHQNGVLVRVFQTGSEGVREVKDRRDSRNDVAFNSDLVFRVGVTSKGIDGGH